MRLDAATLDSGCRFLASRDDALNALYTRNGVPPLWTRSQGFPTLVKLVLEQQVSLASGAAAFQRLETRLGTVTPEAFLTLDDDEIRAAAFSRQKSRYVRGIAASIVDGELDLGALAEMSDGDAIASLQRLTGIGPWTAANYLLFALQRPDIWPSGDRALVVSLGRVLGRTEPPTYPEADEIAAEWHPWRSAAARLLWHDYLGGREYDPAGFS